MVLSVELVRGTRGGEGWGLPSLPWAPGWSFCLCGCHLSEGEGSSEEVGGGHPSGFGCPCDIWEGGVCSLLDDHAKLGPFEIFLSFWKEMFFKIIYKCA